jgi:hypothetical protein
MKQHAFECWSKPEEYPYEVWYTTPKQRSKKFRYFRTLDEPKAWCKRNKGKVTLHFASWQAFELMKQ